MNGQCRDVIMRFARAEAAITQLLRKDIVPGDTMYSKVQPIIYTIEDMSCDAIERGDEKLNDWIVEYLENRADDLLSICTEMDLEEARAAFTNYRSGITTPGE